MGLLRGIGLVLAHLLITAGASASDLSYTFVNFQYIDKTVDAHGINFPVPVQSVEVVTDTGEGISISGSLAIGDRFFLSGRFQSSIVSLSAMINNPLVMRIEEDDFDLIQSQLGVGYLLPIGENFDLVIEALFDSADYDFGSLAGENFDLDDSGIGAEIGFRWNPIPQLEFHGGGRYSPVGTALLTAKEFESDTLYRLGVIWYFFEDLGFGLDFESGQVDTVSVSMRFGFGDLPW